MTNGKVHIDKADTQSNAKSKRKETTAQYSSREIYVYNQWTYRRTNLRKTTELGKRVKISNPTERVPK